MLELTKTDVAEEDETIASQLKSFLKAYSYDPQSVNRLIKDRFPDLLSLQKALNTDSKHGLSHDAIAQSSLDYGKNQMIDKTSTTLLLMTCKELCSFRTFMQLLLIVLTFMAGSSSESRGLVIIAVILLLVLLIRILTTHI